MELIHLNSQERKEIRGEKKIKNERKEKIKRGKGIIDILPFSITFLPNFFFLFRQAKAK